MKTAKSSTKRKVDEIADGFIQIVRNFAYPELYKLLNDSKQPLIYEVSKTEYALGRYVIIKVEHLWQVVNHLGDIQGVFQSKLTAIVYAFLLMRNNLPLARKLVNEDDRVLKAKWQMDFYRTKLSSKLQSDEFKRELYAAKYTDGKIKYTIAKEELEKTLKMAKYLKLGT